MAGRVEAVLLDLLMAVMDSLSVWAAAAGDRRTGLAWRDAASAAMRRTDRYVPYEQLVADSAAEVGLAEDAPGRLAGAWSSMRPWPDAARLVELEVPYGFVTNCSAMLATIATEKSGLAPRFVLSAEDAGWYKPQPEVYRMACLRVGVPAERVLFVAGSAYDAEGARAAGLPAVLVRRRRERADGGIAVVESLGEVVTRLER